MGAYASNFHGDAGSLVGDLTHPSKDDWITAHAAASGLTVVEVERLWQRFQQLGCNEEGVLPAEMLSKPPASTDVFVRNILGNLMSQDSTIHFQTFLSAMKWAENSKLEDKIRGVFHLIYNGQPLTRDLLQKVLSRVYPEDSPESVKRISDVFFQQMDANQTGFIEEEQFVSWVKTLPAETVASILSFNIMPPEVTDGLRSDSPLLDLRPPSADNIARQVASDLVLRQVAEKVARRDWHLVANKLGHTIDDIDQFEKRHPDNKVEQVNSMLTSWKSREGTNAYVETLENALRDSNMNDIALMLYP